LYKGDAQQVSWSGSFNNETNPGLVGVRVGDTDLWVAYMEVPPASRLQYKIILNGKDWIVDPVNPDTSFSGVTGVNNVVTLPGFTVTDERKTRNDIPHGTVTQPLSIESKALGYTVNYWVYTPAGYNKLDRLPVIYAMDGNDFKDERMGALPNVLDNMIADGKIEPMMAIFIDAREPGNPQHNRREDEFLVRPIEHASFITDELVPVVDHTYRTNPQPDARLITGVSYGGLSATFIAASRPDIFHNMAAFSPVYNLGYLTDPKEIEGVQKMVPAANTVTECGPETDFPCPRLPLKIFISGGIPAWDVGDLSGTIADLQRTHYPVAYYQVLEGHSWDNWRGLFDEMLIYFFGTD
jgi:enterochelin esterase family protein